MHPRGRYVTQPHQGTTKVETHQGSPPVTVRVGGLEPPRPCGHWHLKPARLPFRHTRSNCQNFTTLAHTFPHHPTAVRRK